MVNATMTVRGLVDVLPEERRNTFAAFTTLLVLTTAHTLLETARDALFLSKLPAAQLPWMYLGIVVLALVFARIRAADTKPVITAVLGVGAFVIGLFWVAARTLHPWVLYALYVWSGLFASWVTVQFWTLLGRIHTLTQAKRLYGFIGAGAVLGGVFGAWAARAVLEFIGPRSMLLASAALFVAATVPVMMVKVGETPREERSPQQQHLRTSARLLWDHEFARRVLGIVLVATIAVTFTDFLFKARIAAAYPDARTLAAKLSTFYAVTNTIALGAQLFVGPWIFRLVGVQRALFLFPTLLLAGASAVLGTGGALVMAFLLKGIDGTLRYSVHKTSLELLLVPVPDGTRERIKPIIELVGTRGGQAFASVVILGLVALGASNILTIAAIVLLLAALWLATVITIRAHYLDVFRETLRSGGLSGNVELPELDLGALELLFAGLNSSLDVEVLAALELLAEQDRARLIPALILYHPSRDVVVRALQLFSQRGRTDFVSIADRLNEHPDRDVAAAALRARIAVAPDRELLEKRLADPCEQVSITALVALIARGWIEEAEADRRIREAIATRSWRTAAELARAIRDVTGETTAEIGARFDEVLIRLAREGALFKEIHPAESEVQAVDVRVRLEVARAMAVRESPSFLPILVGMLNRHELRATARAAIVRIPGAIDFVDEVMSHEDFARDVRVHLPRTLAFFEPEPAAKKLLARLLVEKDGAVRFKLLRSLVRLRRMHPTIGLDDAFLAEVAENLLDHAEELHRWGIGLSAMTGTGLGAGHHLLLDLVRDKERHARQRLFMLFELLYREDFEEIERGLRSKKPKTHASSVELVENLIRPPLRGRVLALVGEGNGAAPAAMPYEDVLREILTRTGTTMRTLAEYRALELGIDARAITGGRPSAPPAIESLGQRIASRARDLLVPEEGVARAPA
jgi:AAA family ATP:ADP antiporter